MLHDAIDTSTAKGRLTFHLFIALAEFKRDVTHDPAPLNIHSPKGIEIIPRGVMI